MKSVPQSDYEFGGSGIADLLSMRTLQDLSTAQLIELVLHQERVIGHLSRKNQELMKQIQGQGGSEASVAYPRDQDKTAPRLFLQTDSTSRPIVLNGGPSWTLGRGDENTITLDDHCMSRNHAMIQEIDRREYYLIDLGSRNGSFVNHRRVSVPTALKHGDQITLGQTNFLFSCPQQVVASKMTIPSELVQDPVAMATNVLHVRRLISVLVVDIRSFTRLTRQLDEHVLSEVVGAWFNAVGKIIRHYGSWVDKYIGDAVMAVWIHGSHDVSQEEILRPFQALKALYEMTRQMHCHYPLPFPLQIGAGLNTGLAMVGNTGSGDRPDYTALGDTVNAAFRLETSTKQLQVDIALGAKTYEYLQRHCRSSLPFQQQALSLKGYDRPTVVYTLHFSDLAGFLDP
ncbi:adenylate/guanylate cyclase domain-containing protein [Lyngbya confervoides]|uniref:Adenylate/guanylate cyclase domain-containing protein n=1 Tax=Lyngbya confervoides BDU141951 TaxID=1574623 RepID=A0ABD4T105_9CYAN|nr:adenylate/guanylate cyclase domain-containing protein [Lyngbya confervoides]MCM1982091.1 adenylate/guanylate cyclase domain-containing protein [Lyngbya confervoides BDU141951]